MKSESAKSNLFPWVILDFYGSRNGGQMTLYIAVFIITLGYAIFSDIILGVPQGRVAYECAVLTAALLLIGPIVLRSPRLKSFFFANSRTPLGLISATLVVSLLIGIVFNLWATVSKLEDIIQSQRESLEKNRIETREDIEKAKKEVQENIAQILLGTELGTTKSPNIFQVRVNTGDTASVQDIEIKLTSTKYDKDSGKFKVNVIVYSAGHEPMQIEDQEATEEISYFYPTDKNFRIQVINADETSADFRIVHKAS
jgi:hypothetical protein